MPVTRSTLITLEQINESLLSYYLEEQTFGTHVWLHTSERIINQVFPKNPFQDYIFPTIRNAWQELAEYKIEYNPELHALPIAALQCALYFAENDQGETDDDAIGSSIAKQFGCTDYSKFMIPYFGGSLYKDDPDDSLQERIWEDLRMEFKSWDLKLRIPDRKFFKGRYLQFPKSQTVLTHSDIRSFAPFFHERTAGIEPEEIDWKEIHNWIFEDWSNAKYYLPERFCKWFEQQEYRDLTADLCAQVLQRYLVDILDAFKEEPDYSPQNSKIKQIVSSHFLLERRGITFDFYKYNPGRKRYEEVDPRSKIIQGDSVLFERINDCYQVYRLVMNRVRRSEELMVIYWGLSPKLEKHFGDDLETFRIGFDQFQAVTVKDYAELPDYLQKKYPQAKARVHLLPRHGLRVGYRAYLFGCGPTLDLKQAADYSLRKIGSGAQNFAKYDPETAEPGGYQIRGERYLQFDIKKSQFTAREAPERTFCFDTWTYISSDQSSSLSLQGWYLEQPDLRSRSRRRLDATLLEYYCIDLTALK